MSAPIKSAKDAINAMYASSDGPRLSDLLGNSAPKSAPAAPASAGTSAASLHRQAGSPKPIVKQITHTSASAILRRADGQPAAPVVHTSLKLGPKKPSVAKSAPAATRSAKPSSLSSAILAAKDRPVIHPVSRPTRVKKSAEPTAEDIFSPDPEELALAAPEPEPINPVEAIKEATEVAIKKTRRPAGTSSAAPRTRASRSASDAAPASVSVSRPRASRPAGAAAAPAPSGAVRRSARVFQDVVRPPRPRDVAAPAPRPAPDPMAASLGERFAPSAKVPKTRPLDSVKHRFRPAPKGFAASDAAEAYASHPYSPEDFLNPNHSSRAAYAQPVGGSRAAGVAGAPAASGAAPEPPDTSVHIYGMMQDFAAPAGSPAWAASAASAEDIGLGVVEDYRPANGAPLTFSSEPPASAEDAPSPVSDAAPDNNRYILGAKSPFFLDEVNVEKRPLSAPGSRLSSKTADAPGSKLKQPEAATPKTKTLAPKTPTPEPKPAKKPNKSTKKGKGPEPFAAPDLSEPLKARGSSAKAKLPQSAPAKPLKSTKSRPAKSSGPTVIIPARRRSYAPLFILLLITVLLGAIVGALAYLCFFQ